MRSCYTSVFKTLITCIAIITACQSSAQVSSLSPYSRFGIGTILSQGTAVQHALGGTTAGMMDHFTPNMENPGSYSFLYATTFDVGIRGTSLNLSTAESSQRFNFGSISHFNLVFKKQGARTAYAIGLVPYSTTGYSITDTQTYDDIGEVAFTYDGDGGINRANVGFSHRLDIDAVKGILDKGTPKDSLRLKHNVSLGANLNYYFGSLNQTRRVLYADPDYNHTRISSSTNVSDINFTFGGQGLFHLKNKLKGGEREAWTDFAIGAAYSLGTDLNSGFEELSETIRFYTGAEVILDTVQWVQQVDGSISIPQSINVGFSLIRSNKKDRNIVWTCNYFTQDWTNFGGQFGQESDNNILSKARNISTGIQFTPKPLGKSNNIWQRSVYRFGARTTDTYLTLADHQISETALSFGLSIPALNSQTFPPSRMNFGMEIGNRGTTDDNLIQESFVNFYFGFTLTPHIVNKWFVQRKYD